MNLTEEKCRDSLSNIYYVLQGNYCEGCNYNESEFCAKCNIKEDLHVMRKLVHEHFDNPHLKFEELKPDMWVWDKRDNKYVRILRTRIYEYDIGYFYKGQKLLRIYCDSGWYDTEFIENRFYIKEVKDDE